VKSERAAHKLLPAAKLISFHSTEWRTDVFAPKRASPRRFRTCIGIRI